MIHRSNSDHAAQHSRGPLSRAYHTVRDVVEEVNRMRREAAERYPFLQV